MDNNQPDLIDRALEGVDAERKARVLDIVYRLNLNPNDELLLFAIAIGHMETIIADAPSQWRETLDSFNKQFAPWKEHLDSTLETQTKLAAALEMMIQGLSDQSASMHSSLDTLTELKQAQESMLKSSAGGLRSMTDRLNGMAAQLHTLEHRLCATPKASGSSSSGTGTPFAQVTAVTAQDIPLARRAARLLLALIATAMVIQLATGWGGVKDNPWTMPPEWRTGENHENQR